MFGCHLEKILVSFSSLLPRHKDCCILRSQVLNRVLYECYAEFREHHQINNKRVYIVLYCIVLWSGVWVGRERLQ